MHKFTRIAAALTAFAAAGALATGAQAAEGNAEGKFQVKVLGTGVITDGSVKQVKVDALGLTTSGTLTNTATSDNVVPTIALEYFLKPNISLETICCTTAHHVTSAGAIKGMNLINNVVIIPATLTVKYHVTGLPYGIKALCRYRPQRVHRAG
jgi:outer membrane protein